MPERFTCPWCGDACTAYTPRGGDGSGAKLRRHPKGAPGGEACTGSYEVFSWSELTPADVVLRPGQDV